MGCGDSKVAGGAAGASSQSAAKYKAGGQAGDKPQAMTPEESAQASRAAKQKLLDSMLSEHKIDPKMTDMFQNAFTKITTENIIMTDKNQVRKLFPLVDPPAFEHVYSLFDWSSKSPDPKEFVLTLSLLAMPTQNVETEAVLIFTIFDPDGSGTLDKEEFGSLMRATIMSKLTHVEFLMKNEAAGRVFEKHMAAEYTEENIAFYNAVKAWKAEGVCSADESKTIIDTFIRAGSRLEVNIPQTQQLEILRLYNEATAAGVRLPANIFDEAHDEIYKLMDKDSYARFKKNPQEVRELTDALFNQADANGDGIIQLDEYKAWVKSNPDAMNFIRELHTESEKACTKVRNSVYFHRISVSTELSPVSQIRLQTYRANVEEQQKKQGSVDEEDEEEGNEDPAVLAVIAESQSFAGGKRQE